MRNRKTFLLLIILNILLSLSLYGQKKIGNKALSVSLVYTNYIFGENSYINQKVILYDHFTPSSFGKRTTFLYNKNNLYLSFNIELGRGKQKPLNRDTERIENNYFKFSPSIGITGRSPIWKGYSVNLGGGGSFVFADFSHIVNTPTDFQIYSNHSFSSLGLHVFMNSNYDFSSRFGITIPLYFEYFPKINLITYNVGLGLSFKLY